MPAFLSLALLLMSPAAVDVNSLLQQMGDLTALGHRSSPDYKTAQASSYDRKSIAPDKEGWFANDDWGQYVRDEVNEGRTEHVMADLQGPGAVVRIWSANPSGTVRFYFDGESQPRLAHPLADLLDGKIQPFTKPFGYVASKGHNLYFPFPFKKSLKITVDDNPKGADHLYYHVGYRIYKPGTEVETFNKTRILPAALKSAASALAESQKPAAGAGQTLNLAPGKHGEVKIATQHPKAIFELSFRIKHSPKGESWRQVLRHLLLEIDFDGQRCVCSPFGDFFNNVPALSPYNSVPMEVDEDGRFTCRFVMPFKRSALIRLRNESSLPLEIEVQTKLQAVTFDANTYHFHAQWDPEVGSTRPMRDMHFLDVKGEGRFVGCSLAIANPVKGWWGEGDEKVYVDGEAFPSTFGTGTEDYFGYAWSSNRTFNAPYHGQPYADMPTNLGYSCQHRWHIFDSIPFENSFKFDLERWHWEDTPCGYYGTTYWYATPGSTKAREIDTTRLDLQPVPTLPHMEGVIEGESLPVLEATGGTVDVQDGYKECSQTAQVWWQDPVVSDRLVLGFPVEEASIYHVLAHCCSNFDYGTHEIFVNGRSCGTHDFYADHLNWPLLDLGNIRLSKGVNRFEVVVKGSNPKADKRHLFALDYLKLEPPHVL